LRRHRAGRRIARVLSWLWDECGISTGSERVYAGTVIAVTGGWLAAALASGPLSEPLPAIAAIATVILAIPWWLHRRRREKVRVEKIIEDDWPRVAEHIGLAGADIVSAVVDVWGWTARVALKKGITTEQAISKISAIESGMGFRPGSVRIFPDASRADRFTMRVIEGDPHSGPVPWPGPSITIPRRAGSRRTAAWHASPDAPSVRIS
jgi:S-DNA-T family DNA segregation ATPase FtsK/SpoIIIE